VSANGTHVLEGGMKRRGFGLADSVAFSPDLNNFGACADRYFHWKRVDNSGLVDCCWFLIITNPLSENVNTQMGDSHGLETLVIITSEIMTAWHSIVFYGRNFSCEYKVHLNV